MAAFSANGETSRHGPGRNLYGMPIPAVPEALSKGVIDATVIPWEVTGALKVPELVSNHTEFEGNALYTLTFVLAMNKDKYESLPDDLKKVMAAAAEDYFNKLLKVYVGEFKKVDDLIKAGKVIKRFQSSPLWPPRALSGAAEANESSP